MLSFFHSLELEQEDDIYQVYKITEASHYAAEIRCHIGTIKRHYESYAFWPKLDVEQGLCLDIATCKGLVDEMMELNEQSDPSS